MKFYYKALKFIVLRRLQSLRLAILIVTTLTLVQAAQAQLPNERDNIYRTLMAGLKNREATLENRSITGVATEKSFVSEAWWNRIDPSEKGKTARQQGNYADREMAMLRFNLSQRQWYYEIQQLLWAGWSPWFPVNYQRKATDVNNLYQRIACDGEKIYNYAEFIGYASGLIEPLNEPRPGLDQVFFRKWLGMGLQRPFSQTLEIEGTTARLGEIKKEKLGARETYLISLGAAPDDLTEGRAWIDPDIGYAMVRWESMRISRADPKVGMRFILE